jgi:hypothetical protein
MYVEGGRCAYCGLPRSSASDFFFCSEQCRLRAIGPYLDLRYNDLDRESVYDDPTHKFYSDAITDYPSHTDDRDVQRYMRRHDLTNTDQLRTHIISKQVDFEHHFNKQKDTHLARLRGEAEAKYRERWDYERAQYLEKVYAKQDADRERHLEQGLQDQYKQALLDNEAFDAQVKSNQMRPRDYHDIVIPDDTRFSGHWIIAPSGRGKTTLLHRMFLDDLPLHASIIVMDSKGDLINPIKELAAVKDRLLLIEPDADFAFAVNPLDVSRASVMQAITLIEYIMAGLLDAEFTARQAALFRNVVPAIIEALPSPTFETFKDVMTRGLSKDEIQRLNPHSKRFFEDTATGFYSKTYDSTRKEIVWRLDYLMTNPVLRAMFSAVQTKLDMGREMDAGKIILINNSKAILTDEGSEFFGRFFIALIARAAQQRAGRKAHEKKPCYVYIDECQTVIAKDARIPILLDECRSQKIALILAHQRTAQLSPPVLDAVANCAIRMANSDDEAKYLSDKLRMDTDVLRSLPKGTFGTFVRDLTPAGVALKIPYTDLSTQPQMTEYELDGIKQRMRDQFSFTPETHKAPERALRAVNTMTAEADKPIIPPRIKPANEATEQLDDEPHSKKGTW